MKSYFGSNGKNKFIIETPDWLKKKIVERFGEYFDPCPINPQFDGLSISWPRDQVCYVNPPYSRGKLSKWVKKCHSERRFFENFSNCTQNHDFKLWESRDLVEL